jgi:hypothetical protein
MTNTEDEEYSHFIDLENELDMYCNNDNYYINLKKLLELIDCENPYEMCSDNMIKKYIKNNNFVNCKKSFHKGNDDNAENHARIIASLVNLYQKGVNVDKICVLFLREFDDEIDDYKTYVDVDDGFHRLRAYKFLNIDYIPIVYCI